MPRLVIRRPVGGVQEAGPAAPLLLSLVTGFWARWCPGKVPFFSFECQILHTHFSWGSLWRFASGWHGAQELIFSAGSRSLSAPGAAAEGGGARTRDGHPGGAHTADTALPEGTHGVGDRGGTKGFIVTVVAHTRGRTAMKRNEKVTRGKAVLFLHLCRGKHRVDVPKTALDGPCPHHLATGSSSGIYSG